MSLELPIYSSVFEGTRVSLRNAAKGSSQVVATRVLSTTDKSGSGYLPSFSARGLSHKLAFNDYFFVAEARRWSHREQLGADSARVLQLQL